MTPTACQEASLLYPRGAIRTSSEYSRPDEPSCRPATIGARGHHNCKSAVECSAAAFLLQLGQPPNERGDEMRVACRSSTKADYLGAGGCHAAIPYHIYDYYFDRPCHGSRQACGKGERGQDLDLSVDFFVPWDSKWSNSGIRQKCIEKAFQHVKTGGWCRAPLSRPLAALQQQPRSKDRFNPPPSLLKIWRPSFPKRLVGRLGYATKQTQESKSKATRVAENKATSSIIQQKNNEIGKNSDHRRVVHGQYRCQVVPQKKTPDPSLPTLSTKQAPSSACMDKRIPSFGDQPTNLADNSDISSWQKFGSAQLLFDGAPCDALFHVSGVQNHSVPACLCYVQLIESLHTCIDLVDSRSARSEPRSDSQPRSVTPLRASAVPRVSVVIAKAFEPLLRHSALLRQLAMAKQNSCLPMAETSTFSVLEKTLSEQKGVSIPIQWRILLESKVQSAGVDCLKIISENDVSRRAARLSYFINSSIPDSAHYSDPQANILLAVFMPAFSREAYQVLLSRFSFGLPDSVLPRDYLSALVSLFSNSTASTACRKESHSHLPHACNCDLDAGDCRPSHCQEKRIKHQQVFDADRGPVGRPPKLLTFPQRLLQFCVSSIHNAYASWTQTLHNNMRHLVPALVQTRALQRQSLRALSMVAVVLRRFQGKPLGKSKLWNAHKDATDACQRLDYLIRSLPATSAREPTCSIAIRAELKYLVALLVWIADELYRDTDLASLDSNDFQEAWANARRAFQVWTCQEISEEKLTNSLRTALLADCLGSRSIAEESVWTLASLCSFKLRSNESVPSVIFAVLPLLHEQLQDAFADLLAVSSEPWVQYGNLDGTRMIRRLTCSSSGGDGSNASSFDLRSCLSNSEVATERCRGESIGSSPSRDSCTARCEESLSLHRFPVATKNASLGKNSEQVSKDSEYQLSRVTVTTCSPSCPGRESELSRVKKKHPGASNASAAWWSQKQSQSSLPLNAEAKLANSVSVQIRPKPSLQTNHASPTQPITASLTTLSTTHVLATRNESSLNESRKERPGIPSGIAMSRKPVPRETYGLDERLEEVTRSLDAKLGKAEVLCRGRCSLESSDFSKQCVINSTAQAANKTRERKTAASSLVNPQRYTKKVETPCCEMSSQLLAWHARRKTYSATEGTLTRCSNSGPGVISLQVAHDGRTTKKGRFPPLLRASPVVRLELVEKGDKKKTVCRAVRTEIAVSNGSLLPVRAQLKEGVRQRNFRRSRVAAETETRRKVPSLRTPSPSTSHHYSKGQNRPSFSGVITDAEASQLISQKEVERAGTAVPGQHELEFDVAAILRDLGLNSLAEPLAHTPDAKGKPSLPVEDSASDACVPDPVTPLVVGLLASATVDEGHRMAQQTCASPGSIGRLTATTSLVSVVPNCQKESSGYRKLDPDFNKAQRSKASHGKSQWAGSSHEKSHLLGSNHKNLQLAESSNESLQSSGPSHGLAKGNNDYCLRDCLEDSKDERSRLDSDFPAAAKRVKSTVLRKGEADVNTSFSSSASMKSVIYSAVRKKPVACPANGIANVITAGLPQSRHLTPTPGRARDHEVDGLCSTIAAQPPSSPRPTAGAPGRTRAHAMQPCLSRSYASSCSDARLSSSIQRGRHPQKVGYQSSASSPTAGRMRIAEMRSYIAEFLRQGELLKQRSMALQDGSLILVKGPSKAQYEKKEMLKSINEDTATNNFERDVDADEVIDSRHVSHPHPNAYISDCATSTAVNMPSRYHQSLLCEQSPTATRPVEGKLKEGTAEDLRKPDAVQTTGSEDIDRPTIEFDLPLDRHRKPGQDYMTPSSERNIYNTPVLNEAATLNEFSVAPLAPLASSPETARCPSIRNTDPGSLSAPTSLEELIARDCSMERSIPTDEDFDHFLDVNCVL